ncbi:MAG: hypothetical protein ACJ707_02920, partial [Nitrososphaera sp.]
IAGIVLNKASKIPNKVEKKTAEIIERFVDIPVIAEIPFSRGANYVALGKLLEDNCNLETLLSM